MEYRLTSNSKNHLTIKRLILSRFELIPNSFEKKRNDYKETILIEYRFNWLFWYYVITIRKLN